jgi:hypothetical protein
MDIDMDTRPASAHDSTIHHKTLSAYYSRLFKLEAYLDSIPGLLDPEDADAYRELLGTTLCAPRGSATVPEYVVPMGSHSEAIDEIMNDMRGRTDVLLMSVRVSRLYLLPSDAQHQRYQYNTPQNVVPDIPGPSSILLRPPWRVLRIR